MALGPWVRRILPARAEKLAADTYRGLFVDLDKVAGCLAKHVPDGALLLDVGGGDGDLLNRLLALRADLSVDMVDIADRVGALLDVRFEARVRRFPSTTLEQHASAHAGLYRAALISDVMHHVPPRAARCVSVCGSDLPAAGGRGVHQGRPARSPFGHAGQVLRSLPERRQGCFSRVHRCLAWIGRPSCCDGGF